MKAARHIGDLRDMLYQQEQEVDALQSEQHATRGQLASLETLQRAALGQQHRRGAQQRRQDPACPAASGLVCRDSLPALVYSQGY